MPNKGTNDRNAGDDERQRRDTQRRAAIKKVIDSTGGAVGANPDTLTPSASFADVNNNMARIARKLDQLLNP